MTATALLIFARCAGFLFRAPGFSHPSVPHLVRIGLCVTISAAIASSVSPVHRDGIALVLALVIEFATGTAMGLAASLIYDGAYAGGRMLDDIVGVKAIAPSVDVVAPSGFGRMWSIACTGGYFLLGAYGPALMQFRASFERIAPGVPFQPHAWGPFVISFAGTIVMAALAVAAPAIALAFVAQIALAALSRTIPRFTTFALSFPVVFGVVLIVTAVSIPVAVARAGHPMTLFPVLR